MSTELKVPSAGESITEVTIVEWLKKEGAWAARDETVAVIETDKANVEVNAPVAGVLTRIIKGEGEEAIVGEVIAHMEAQEQPRDAASEKRPAASGVAEKKAVDTVEAVSSAVNSSAAKGVSVTPAPAVPSAPSLPEGLRAPPSIRRAVRQGLVPAEQVRGPGLAALSEGALARSVPSEPAIREEERVKMTRLRKTIAQRLVTAQQTAAILTTFNEVDMSAVMGLRKIYKESFADRHGVKLGFMSFFVKATIEALKDLPQINASIEGDNIIYHNYYDIGVAVGGGRGLVVPVIRNAERLNFAQIEQTIGDFGRRAKDNKITPDELQGGTFTISNGGVYGSMMSTPIINPPQSGILGLHAIKERPVVRDGQVVVAPMMFIALSYDHRIVDGREAVTFLVRIKECIENPSRMLLEV
ncbi:MAG: 2-oxoglutarate dehydrogenase complex dihydrolipoyllysine-residue succinyltransferase [Myxococcales bacterium]|nr:2-oxoglutarate dehydrogenase complex dihydrolipoyllysine-residue succinyltransferase [Myxococcales bacterium]